VETDKQICGIIFFLYKRIYKIIWQISQAEEKRLKAGGRLGSGLDGLLPKYPFRLPKSVLNKSKACER